MYVVVPSVRVMSSPTTPPSDPPSELPAEPVTIEPEAPTTESVGLHAAVTKAMIACDMVALTRMQAQLLSVAAQALQPDMILESRPRMGRHMCSACYAAHRSLTANAISIIVCDNAAHASQQKAAFDKLNAEGLGVEVAGFSEGSTVKEKLTGPVVIICTVEAVASLTVDTLSQAVLLLVQDVHQQVGDSLVGAMSHFANHSYIKSNVILFTSRTAYDIHASIRYLLRRSNRRYYVLSDDDQQTGGLSSANAVTYTSLLCHDAEDRLELTCRALELPGVRHALVLAHNKEISDLRNSLVNRLGGRVYYMQRGPTGVKTLSDFLESRSATLVAAVGFADVDMLDVDMVIMCYPPQKSMRDDEWNGFLSFLKATGHRSRPSLVVTITGNEEISSTALLFKKLHTEMPILNLAPTHPDFHELLRRPQLALVASLAKFVPGALAPTEGGQPAGPVDTPTEAASPDAAQ